jgi:hypothetical protein
MRWVTAHHQKLSIDEKSLETPWPTRPSFGFEESITRGAVHELLFQPSSGGEVPLFPALLAARTATTKAESPSHPSVRRTLVWVDAAGTFYPPAVQHSGITSEQICVLRPRSADLVWATIECLRCQSVGAVVALVTQRLTRVEVRRLQLAAERGGTVGLLLRPNLGSACPGTYAAATRWLVAPAPGERTVQRWHLQLIYGCGHGGQIGQSLILEKHRASGQTNFVRLSAPLAHHPKLPAAS